MTTTTERYTAEQPKLPSRLVHIPNEGYAESQYVDGWNDAIDAMENMQ